MRASTRSILAVALATSAFAALPARAREHELKVPDDSYGIWFPDRSNFDEDVPPPTKATLDALRAADKDRKVEWDEASRTLTVDFPGNADHAPVIATRTRIRWGTNGSIALLETTGNAGDTDTYFCPCTFEGWSENLGAVYRLDKKRTYIAFKGGEIRSFRLFDKHLEWTEPSFAGAVTPWKSVAAAVEDAVKNKDVAAADRALGGRTPPIWGEPGLLWLRVEYLRHPIADVAPLAARLKASTTIEARVDALDALNAYRKAATPLRKREWDALRGKYGTIAGAPKQPGELAEEAATKLIDAEIPRLLRDVQARAETAMRAGRFGEARSMGAVAHRMRCNPEAIRLESETEKAFLWSTFGNTNPDYYNVTLIKGEVKGIKPKLRLIFSGMATDEFALRTVMIEVPEPGAGTWVDDPDVPARLAEFEDAKRELASIDDELAALDAGPLGTTVLGDRGVEVHEIFVDADSREHDTVAYASSQNVYRIGVGKDAKNRAALRAELKSRRALLASIVAAGPRTKRYVPGSGTVKKVPVECGAIPAVVSVTAFKGDEKFEAGGKFSFEIPCTPGAASDVNRFAKDVRSDFENEAARAAAAKSLAGDPDGAWSVFWLGQGLRPDDEIGKLLDGGSLCTQDR